VTHVHYIHNRTFRTIGGMIFFIWLTSVIVSLAPLFGWKDSDFETRVNVKKECIVGFFEILGPKITSKDYLNKIVEALEYNNL
jgi:hypothetical protein